MVEYKKFKDAALHLQECELFQENVFAREGTNVILGADPEKALQDVSLFDLITAFNSALQNVPKEELREIFSERFTVAEKIDHIVQLIETRESLRFSELFNGMISRNEIVCTFLAILELIRLKQIQARQDSRFSEILVVQAAE